MNHQRIRYYRQRKNLTQEQLAHGICSVSYLSKYENGAPASEEIVKLLCERLNISYQENDSEDAIREVKDLLDEWYIEIQKRNLKSSGALEEEIKKKIADIESPELSLTYDLFRMRYLLLCERFDEVRDLKEKTWQLKDHFTDELYYYYLNFSGIYFFGLNDFRKSLEYLKQAEKEAERISLGDTSMAELYYQLALLNTHLFLVSSAMNYTYKALPIFDEHYNLERCADCHILLGISNRRIRNYEQSVYHYENALKLAKSTNNKQIVAVIYHNLGYVSASQGNSDKAIEYYKKCLNIDSSYIRSIYLIAKEYYKLDKLSEAKKWIEKGFKITDGNPQKEYTYHFKILKYQIDKTFNEEYETFLKDDAIPFFENKMQGEYVAEYTEYLGDYYFNKHQYKNAAKSYQLAIQARKEIY